MMGTMEIDGNSEGNGTEGDKVANDPVAPDEKSMSPKELYQDFGITQGNVEGTKQVVFQTFTMRVIHPWVQQMIQST